MHNEEELTKNARKEIEETYNGFVKAVKNKNMDLVSSYFLDDCILLYPGMPKVTGIEQGSKVMEPMLKGLVDFEIEVSEVYLLDEKTAIETGKNKMVHEIAGERKETPGTYAVHWEKQSTGEWKVKMDIGLPP